MFNLFSVDPKTGDLQEVQGMTDARGFLLKEHNDDGSHGTIAGDLTVNGRVFTPNQPRVKLRLPAATTSIADTTDTSLSWADPLASGPYGPAANDGGYQVGNFWDTNNPTRIKIPYNGFYFISYSIEWAGSAVGNRIVEIDIGVPIIMRTRQNGGNGGAVANTCSEILYLVAGQALVMIVQQTSGAPLNIFSGAGSSRTWLQVQKIG
jgi:hypothetical protein